MIITTIMNVFAILLASLASYKIGNKYYLMFSFLIIFIYLALRYDFGNDYMHYHDYFLQVHKTSIKDLLNINEFRNLGLKEICYTWLNKLFANFYLMVAVLSFFSCFVYYVSIKSYVEQSFMWLSVFIFLFHPMFMLVQSSALRQTVAICLFIYSIRYLVGRNFWKFSFLIVLGSLFHQSAIVLLPIYFLVTSLKWNRRILFAIIGCFVVITFFGGFFLGGIDNIAAKYFPRYQEAYMTDIVGDQLNSGLGFLFESLIFLFIIWAHNKGEIQDTIISKLSIIGFVLSPLGMYLSAFSRIGMYFSPIILLSLPFAISLQKTWQLRIIIILVVMLYYLHNYFNFFYNPVWIEKFYTYKINLIDGI